MKLLQALSQSGQDHSHYLRLPRSPHPVHNSTDYNGGHVDAVMLKMDIDEDSQGGGGGDGGGDDDGDGGFLGGFEVAAFVVVVMVTVAFMVPKRKD